MQLAPVLRKASEIGVGLTAIATLILAGCGGGGSSSGGAAGTGAGAETTTLTITPGKGYMHNARVHVRNIPTDTVIGTGLTASSGVASVAVLKSATGPFLVEVTCDTSCDYFDEKSLAMVSGTSAATPLQAVIPDASITDFGVTAATNAAAELAMASGTPTTETIAAANATVGAQIGNISDILTPPTIIRDLTTFNAAKNGTTQANKLAYFSAALAKSASGVSALQAIADYGKAWKIAVINPASGVVLPPSIHAATATAALSSFPVSTIPNITNTFKNNQLTMIAATSGISGAANIAHALHAAASSVGAGQASSVAITAGQTFVSVPVTVTGISPTTAAVGASVTITGTGFDSTFSNNTVQFNGTQATVTAGSKTSLTVTVPTGATSGTISVTNTLSSLANKTGTSNTSFTVTTSSPTTSTPTNSTSAPSVCVASWKSSQYSSAASYNACYVNLPANFSCDQTTLSTQLAPYANTGQFSLAFATQTTCPYDRYTLDAISMGGTSSGTGDSKKTAVWGVASAVQQAGTLAGVPQGGYEKGSLPKVKFDTQGNGFAYWSRNNGANPQTQIPSFSLVYSRYTASTATWSPEQVLSGSDNIVTYGKIGQGPTVRNISDIEVSATGDAVAAWLAHTNDFMGNQFSTLKVSRYSSSTNQWSNTETIPVPNDGGRSGSVSSFPILAISDSGTAIVLWNHSSGNVYAAYSTPTSTSWTKATVAPAARVAGHKSLVFDSTGNAIAVWSETNYAATGTAAGYTPALKSARFDGTTKSWGAVQTVHTASAVTGSDGNEGWPAIAFDPNGVLHAVWTESNGSNTTKVWAAKLNNGGWSTPVNLDTSIDNSGGSTDIPIIKLRFDSLGNGTVIWPSKTSANYFETVAARYTSGAWGTGIRVSLGANNSVEIDSKGNALAIGDGYNTYASAAKIARFNVNTNIWQPVPSNKIGIDAQIVFDSIGNAIFSWGDGGAIYNVGDNSWSTVDGAAGRYTIYNGSILSSLSMSPTGTAIALWLGTGSKVTARTITIQ